MHFKLCGPVIVAHTTAVRGAFYPQIIISFIY